MPNAESERPTAPLMGTPCSVLGVPFTPMTTASFREVAEAAVESGRSVVVGGHNVHSVYLYHHDAKMRRFYDLASYAFLDGMPLVWLSRALGLPVRREHRNAPFDWMPSLLSLASERGWRVFFLGSTPEIATRGTLRLRERFPGLAVESHHGYFDATAGSAEGAAVVRQIRDFDPHILCVCMGMPRQEHWIVDHHAELPARVIFNLGALLDLFAGAINAPPRWVGQIGFEWLYRLLTQPKRVWRRYLWEPWFLAPYLAGDIARALRRRSTAPRAPVAPRGKPAA